MNRPDDLLVIGEVAERLRLTSQSLRVLRHRGRGPKGFIVAGSLRYFRSDVDQWIREQQERDASAA
jgi:DNA-binding transcriptional MerR regulator